MAQPRIEQTVEPVQTNPIFEEEEEVIKEPVQSLITHEKEVLESPILEVEESLEKEVEVRSPKPRPFLDINAANIHDDIVNLPHHSGDLLDKIHKVCEEILDDEEEGKYESDSEKYGPEQSMQISSNEGSSDDGTKLMKSMTSLMGTLQKNMAVMESNMTLKKNTYEIHILNKSYTKFGKNFFKQKTDLLDYEREKVVELHNEVMDGISLLRDQMVEIQGNMSRADAERLEQNDSFARKIQAEEDAKSATEKEKNLITQGDDNSGRRGGGVSTGTRSKRKPTGDDNIRPIKRGGGHSGDRSGRSSGGDSGGRSGGSGRGGRSLPLFRNLLTGKEFSCQGSRYPIEPLVKREDK
ncbi:keratin, type I cytoskeletal 10-like [Impatiens glandulifera]|uniref:keratin, type I cytoskeletal 10-like n=1 Tax=Impatiens glandulifera TaxID=253017 RepID=UPI001FB18EFE|nr:keratin, type I cytoskeletal 10-like [Impatiens glandulifera]